MREHAEHAGVQAAGCMAIFSIAWDNPEVQELLCEAGAVEAILEAMTLHVADSTVHAMACAALSNNDGRHRGE